MERLTALKCTACRRGEPTVTEAEAAELLTLIPGWGIVEREGVKQLEKRFSFRDFKGALAFTARVGALAEEEGHHPAILTEWGGVTLRWWTHAIRGIHRNDFIMAAKADALGG